MSDMPISFDKNISAKEFDKHPYTDIWKYKLPWIWHLNVTSRYRSTGND